MEKKYLTNMENNIHIGNVLATYIKSKKIFKSVLARKMQRADGTILRFMKSNSMNTAILIEFCYAMKHNFFRDIADKLPPEFTIDAIPDTAKDDRIAALEQEITILKAEKEVLIRVMRE